MVQDGRGQSFKLCQHKAAQPPRRRAQRNQHLVQQAKRSGTDAVWNKGLTDLLPWDDVMNVLYYGQAQRDPGQMVAALKRFFAGN